MSSIGSVPESISLTLVIKSVILYRRKLDWYEPWDPTLGVTQCKRIVGMIGWRGGRDGEIVLMEKVVEDVREDDNNEY